MRLRRPFIAAPVAAAWIASFAIAASAATLASYDRAPATGPWSLAPGEYYVDLTGTSFQTGSGYDTGGHLVSLGETAEQRTFRSNIDLGWKKKWSWQISLPFVTRTERAPGGVAASVTGLEDLGLGLRYAALNGPRAVAVQLAWEAPAGYNHRLAPSVGDGLQKLSATVQVGSTAGKCAFWQLGGGMRFQYQALTDISDQVTRRPQDWKWPEHMIGNGGAAVWLGHLLAAGQFAVDASSFLPGGQASGATSFVVGPRLTYRTDGRLDVFAGSWHTPSGRNSLALDQYYAGIAWKSTKLNRLQGFLGGDARP